MASVHSSWAELRRSGRVLVAPFSLFFQLLISGCGSNPGSWLTLESPPNITIKYTQDVKPPHQWGKPWQNTPVKLDPNLMMDPIPGGRDRKNVEHVRPDVACARCRCQGATYEPFITWALEPVGVLILGPWVFVWRQFTSGSPKTNGKSKVVSY